ncbi:MAG: DUF2793 domain-containing protein [Rhizobiaceae bacterium]|nr:DUF2793 domain-containing protein [Rhizobiaceae bacterium]
MSETTSNLALPYILPAQAQKHVTHNEALKALDAVVQLSVVSKKLTSPPTEPAQGDRYIVAPGAVDDWLGQDGNLAAYQDAVWSFYPANVGWSAWVEEENQTVIFTGNSWVWPEYTSPFGAFTRLQTLEEELTLSGSVTTAIVEFPSRAIVLAVSVMVAETISGASTFEIGIDGESSKFGGSLGINAGDSNIGVIGPTAVYAPTPVILSAVGGDFSAGTVRLVLHYIECGPALM